MEMKEIERGGRILSAFLAPPMKCRAQPLDNYCFDVFIPQNLGPHSSRWIQDFLNGGRQPQRLGRKPFILVISS